MLPVVRLTMDLMSRKSITPLDEGCQALMADRLADSGFGIRHMPIHEVSNLWARHGTGSPLLVFAGHTDVVPTGALADWESDPFEPEIRDGYLFGRGAADMKGSLAAMVVAAERFVSKHPSHQGSLAFLITSDEEGDAYYGTEAVVKQLTAEGEVIDWALIGEPSSSHILGDTVKVGRRGSLLGRLRIKGKQGHVAYPDLAKNPVHLAAPAILALSIEHWDNGNDGFPPTSFQISNFQSGTGATNVIPGEASVMFSFRFSTEVTADTLERRVRDILDNHQLDYVLEMELKGVPFLTEKGSLIRAVEDAVATVVGKKPVLSTAGGTSDGRFIAPTGAQVVELGPVNKTIHQVNESVAVDSLDDLAKMYEGIMENLLID
jgi:succinyl-diaminopimelate desuccinylase